MVTLTFLAGWNTSLSGAGSGSAGRIMADFGASGSLSPAVRTIASTGDRPIVLGFALCFLGIFTTVEPAFLIISKHSLKFSLNSSIFVLPVMPLGA
jgi:hypothetical protein